jgi:hypothetical protein
MHFAFRAIAVVLVAAACTSQGEQGTATPDWQLSSTPRIAVGDVDGTDSMVFARVTDARLMASGELMVADGGASVLVVFDTAGVERIRLGRKGRGPGEFTGVMTLAELAADSIAVWDDGQSRWTLVHADEPTLDPSARIEGPSAWIHAGVLVLSERALMPAWTPPLLQRLADSIPEIRHGFLDETSLLWVNTDTEGRVWQAYTQSEPVGRLTLPASMRPTQFRSDAIVGVQTDSLGLERVVVHTLTRPAGIAPDRTPAAPLAPDSTARYNLTAAMRTSVMAQEMQYANGMSYTMNTDSLNVEMPAGTRFKVLEANKRGWSGVGYVTATGFTCGMIVGGRVPRGWSEGEVRCGW